MREDADYVVLQKNNMVGGVTSQNNTNKNIYGNHKKKITELPSTASTSTPRCMIHGTRYSYEKHKVLSFLEKMNLSHWPHNNKRNPKLSNTDRE